MNTDNKTLADVKPGGRVRLGDQAERARFEAWARKHGLSSRTLREAYEEAQQAALSAQPSPPHQIDAETLWWLQDAINAMAEGGNQSHIRFLQRLHDSLAAQPSPGGQDVLFIEELAELRRLVPSVNQKQALDAAIAALAARQPVRKDALVTDEMVDAACRAYYDAAEDVVAVDHTYMEAALKAALAARQPVGVPVAWMHTHKATGRVEFGLSPMYDYDFNAVQWDSVALYAAPAQAVDYQAALLAEERSHSETIDQRDRCEEVADELADRIARITGVDIGEHSSANCPWQNAIDAAEEYKPAQAVDLGQFRDLAEFALRNAKLHNCWEKREALARELLALIDSHSGVNRD